MLKTRVIPCLLLRGRGLDKTIKFKKPTYVGDPINAVKIFNDKEVDELLVLDIDATSEGREPPMELIHEIAEECFMPLAYGGGVRTLQHVEHIVAMGVEKVAVNTKAVEAPDFIRAAADSVGSQSIVVSIDVRRGWLGKYEVCTHGGDKRHKLDPVEFARRVADAGAGEILLNSIDRDGTMEGFDLELVSRVASAVEIPVIACGGAGSIEHFAQAKAAGASAVSAGSMFVFRGKHRAVLISYPSIRDLEQGLQ